MPARWSFPTRPAWSAAITDATAIGCRTRVTRSNSLVLGSTYSGIAIRNVGNSPVTIDLSLQDEDGNEIPNGATTITYPPALGYVVRFIHVSFPEAALDDFTGSLIAEVSGGRIAATALESGSTAGLACSREAG